MTFHDIQYYIEGYGCTLDPLGEDYDGAYYASNCISGNVCIVERLDVYADITICHYCDELKIPVPSELQDMYVGYSQMRDHLNSVAVQEEEDEE